MLYYRVALQDDQTNNWRWKSTILTSLDALFGFLKLYSMIPRASLRVFYSSTVECMNAMLERENNSLESNSIMAEQLLTGKKSIHSFEMVLLEKELGLLTIREKITSSISVAQPQNERKVNSFYMGHVSSTEMRWLELEFSKNAELDIPYEFELPTSAPQVIAWIDLLVKVYSGKLVP
jgi:hypothetical protein